MERAVRSTRQGPLALLPRPVGRVAYGLPFRAREGDPMALAQMLVTSGGAILIGVLAWYFFGPEKASMAKLQGGFRRSPSLSGVASTHGSSVSAKACRCGLCSTDGRLATARPG